MDIALLTAFLTPFLPALTQLGEKAAGKMAEKFGEDAWNKAKAIWGRLSPQLEAKEAAQEAVTDLANAPEDEDLQTALRVQLKKLLDQNQALAVAVAQLFQAPGPQATPATQITQRVTGNQNQVIGQVLGGQVLGNVTGTVIIGGAAGVPGPPAPDPAPQQGPTAVKTILVLAANPKGSHPLRLGEEVRKIQTGLERSPDRSTPMTICCDSAPTDLPARLYPVARVRWYLWKKFPGASPESAADRRHYPVLPLGVNPEEISS